MCTSPLLIRNRKYRSLSVKTPNTFIKVPCGLCDECLRKRAKDMYVRARYEVEEAYRNGGVAFMCTLTYGLQLAPTFEHLGKKVFCFQKKDVILFMKRLRSNLDRLYKRYYNTSAPDFKYLVTSEFGTSDEGFHLPHYHLLVSFRNQISLFLFRKAFMESLVNRKDNFRYFGPVFQCDLLDLSRGGVKYVTKYILKDLNYVSQQNIIKEKIKFATQFVNTKHGIIDFPQNQNECLSNKCIRRTKEYIKDIETYVLPLRHKLQFYMCSNDFGCSAICSRYGESLFSLGMLTLDGFPYSIPKQVVQRLERTEGSDKKDTVVKTIFCSQFEKSVNDCLHRGLINQPTAFRVLDFAKNFIQPRFGSLYFINPLDVSFWNKDTLHPVHDFDSIYSELCFYEENNFYELRNEVISILNLSNSSENLRRRAKLAFAKSEKERKEYEQKKRNKGYKV